MSKNWIKLLILCMCTIFLLIGCGNIEEDIKDDLDEKFEDKVNEQEKDVKEEDEESEKEKENKETVDEKDLAGYWDDDVYVNEHFDIELELPKNWEKMTDEELESKSKLENMDYLVCADSKKGPNINVAYQDLREYGMTDEMVKETDIDDYMEIYYEAFKNSSIYDDVEIVDNEKVGKNEFGVMTMSMEFSDSITVYQKLYALKKDNVILLIYFTALSESEVDKLSENLG